MYDDTSLDKGAGGSMSPSRQACAGGQSNAVTIEPAALHYDTSPSPPTYVHIRILTLH